MTAITTFDCTLRDGGNQNNWGFTTLQAARIVAGLDAAGVDVIEVGYRGGSGSRRDQSAGAAAESAPAYLASLPRPAHASLAVMVVPSVCPLEALRDLADSAVSMVRIAAYPWDIARTHEYVAGIRDLGMRTSVNLMALSYVDNLRLREIAESFRAARIRPDVFYVADSFGSLYPAAVTEKIGILAQELGSEIGIHTHNNLGLAAANTIAALEAGATWVDSSLCGMARGAGNFATEQSAAILATLPGYESSADIGRVCDIAEFVRDDVMPERMVVERDQISAGLNDHHYYFQSTIREESARFGLKPLVVGRRIGELRPRSVSRDLVVEVCESMTKEGITL